MSEATGSREEVFLRLKGSCSCLGPLSGLCPMPVRTAQCLLSNRLCRCGTRSSRAARSTPPELRCAWSTMLRSTSRFSVAGQDLSWRAQGESNPCFRRERATSWTARRWARRSRDRGSHPDRQLIGKRPMACKPARARPSDAFPAGIFRKEPRLRQRAPPVSAGVRVSNGSLQ